MRRRPKGVFYWLFLPFALALAIYVIGAATYFIIAPWTLTVLFLSGMMALGFLTTGAFEDSVRDRPSAPDLALAALSLASGAYFAFHAERIVDRIVLLDPLTTADIVFATLVFLLTLEVTRRTTGLGLLAVVLVFVAYNLFGDRLSGVLQHGVIDFRHFLEITVFTTDGIFGLPVRVAATYAFMFVLFGTLLEACGGGKFFFDFAAAVSGRKAGGPAKIAVVSSGMYGMISGSPTADVVTTGSITIPVMKKLGYSGRYAAAIEVAASTGGSIMPPVMGTAAFIMVDFTGIEYREIAIAALLPALLYYLSVYSQVHFSARRRGLGQLAESRIPRLPGTLRDGGLFLVPLAVLTVALLYGYTPTMVAVYGCLAVLAVAMLRASSRIGPLGVARVLSETCYRMVPVAGACAAAGLVIAGITMTGLAAKFAHVVYGITHAQLLPTLLVAAAITTVLGMGMPTPSAYILAAALMAPMVEKLGVPTLETHMFILYYAVMSALTPPVAVAAYAAASIADDNPLYIAGLAVKFALAAFVVPFVFVYAPELLLDGPWQATLLTLGTAVPGFIIMAAAIEGFMFRRLAAWERLLLGAAGFALVLPSLQLAVIGALVYAAFAGRWFLARRAAS
ncbi:MAG TPA: TRAP transporter fused permease subunit [Burkholderiales bacterium]